MAERSENESPNGETYSRQVGNNVASSSGSNIRSSLIEMGFAPSLVDTVIEEKGFDAPINELVDFISAAQIARKLIKGTADVPRGDGQKKKFFKDKISKAMMRKTLQLLEMGFSHNDISLAFLKHGSMVRVSKLAGSICEGDLAPSKRKKKSSMPYTASPLHMKMRSGRKYRSDGELIIKTEEEEEEEEDIGPAFISLDQRLQFEIDQRDDRKGKMPLDAENERHFCRTILERLLKPPYFFYGNVVDLPAETWEKISRFLFSLEPEFVNTDLFSALTRREGYIHNIPTVDRFNILPKSGLTIQEAVPSAKQWWPAWDTRKQLSCLGSAGTSELVDRLCCRIGKAMMKSRGVLSSEQQQSILRRCTTSNLIWSGPNIVSPLYPQQLESILGYPKYHSLFVECSLPQKLESIRYSFQTDTLGYHLSVLKAKYPDGLTMMSVFTGIGGAEVSLHRLGIRLKAVISIEACEDNRRILRSWWLTSGQTGELVQIENIRKLKTEKITSLIEEFGTIDFIIGQNPCSATAAQADNTQPGFDFSLFFEFVRVVQRVRDIVGTKKLK